MRINSFLVIAGSVSIALCGCSYEKLFPGDVPTLANQVAIDRALRHCSLTEGDVPFHLLLDVSPPRGASQDMRVQVELFWVNAATYRTVIRSPRFSQIRIVNGSVVEEHNVGDFYPRWIQNFVDALLEPVPNVGNFRKTNGQVPVSTASHACIVNPEHPVGIAEETLQSRVCFMDAEPKLASGKDFTRYVSFGDFAPFGSKEVARTLVNSLPANLLVNGRIILLEPLAQADYGLVKARKYTSPLMQIQTRLVPQAIAESLLEYPLGEAWLAARSLPLDKSADPQGKSDQSAVVQMTIYIRTDRSGRVREAYRDSNDIYGLQDAAVARAMSYRFKPLLVRGAAQQMEAPITLPTRTIR